MERNAPDRRADLADLESAYGLWSSTRDSNSMGVLLRAAAPVINSALTTYVGRPSPIYRAAAKSLAVKAIQQYDPARKVPLRNYLYQQLQPLRRLAARDDVVPVPEAARRQLAELRNKAIELQDKWGREPTDQELADATGINPKRIFRLHAYATASAPESAIVDEHGAPQPIPASRLDPRDLWREYVRFDLAPRDRRLLEMLESGIPRIEIARRLRVTPSAVTQQAQRIFSRLEQYDAG